MEYKTVFFKNDEIYKKSKNSFFIQAFFKGNDVEVWIDDLGKSVWQKPLKNCINLMTGEFCETKEYGNPKVKHYTIEEFNTHFYIP